MRANLLDELRKPYVMTARARGVPERRVILKYPVRVALNPFASTVGYLLPYVVSGSIIVSLVLSLPTVGPLLLKALVAQDMFLAGTIVLLLGVLTVVGTFLSDLLLLWIDPADPDGRQAIAELPVPHARRCRGARHRARLRGRRRRRRRHRARSRGRRGGRGAHLGRQPVAAHVVALPPPPAGDGGHGDRGALLPRRDLRGVPGVRAAHRVRGPALAAAAAADPLVRRGPLLPARPRAESGSAIPSRSSGSTRRTRTKKIRVRFFAPGFEYHFLGVFPANRHLLGVEDARPEETLFLLGTDEQGRDHWSRLMYATRTSLTIGLAGVALRPGAGRAARAASPATTAASIDTVIQRVIEILRSIPTIPLWMGLAAALPNDWSVIQVYFAITVIISLIGWTELARVVRGRFLSLREEEFVMAAELAGCSRTRIILSHLVPSFLSPHHRGDHAGHPGHDHQRDVALVPGPRAPAAGDQLGRAPPAGAEHPGARHLAVAPATPRSR